MKLKYASYKFLLAALLCFVVAAGLNIYSYILNPTERQNYAEVNSNVEDAVRKANRDMNRVKPFLSGDTLNFHELLNNKPYYATFIFKNGQAVFWTDHTLVVDFIPQVLPNEVRVAENKFGKYLVSGTTYKNYHIQVYIPLEKQYGISNRYLESGLNDEIFGNRKIRVVFDPRGNYPKVVYGQQYLFSMQPSDENTARTISQLAIALICLGVIFLVWALVQVSKAYLKYKNQYWRSLLLLFVPLLSIRLILLYFNFPFAVWELEAFNPRLFAASDWSPSIGDLLLNAIMLLIFTLHLNQVLRKNRIKAFLGKVSEGAHFWIKIGCTVGFYALLLWLYSIYYTTFSNSALVMDITQSMQFSVYELLLYAAFVAFTVIFLVLSHLLMQIFYQVQGSRQNPYLLGGVALVAGIFLVSGFINDRVSVILLGISLFFYLAILFSQFRKNISSNPFQHYLFIFWIISISALTGSLAMYQYYHQQLIGQKQRFARDILLERDIQGELILEDISRLIQRDKIIKSKLTSPFANKDFVRVKIQKYYLRDYFDKYESAVKIFDANNMASDVVGNQYSLNDYRKSYLREAVKTEHPGLYLIKPGPVPFSRRYVKFISVIGRDGSRATIALELSQTKQLPYSVIPELLVDQRNFEPLYSRSFGYVLYQNNLIQHTEGNFGDMHYFTPKFLQDPRLYQQGVRLQGRHHWGFISGNRRIVITTEQYSLRDVLSNFSFLFLVHTFVFLLYVFSFLLLKGGVQKALNTAFSTKIQLFLNFGVLIPLLVVSVATGSLVTASYKKDLHETYQNRGKMVQQSILNSWSWPTYQINRDALREEVSSIAELAEADIDIYDAQGRLITSSQPLIFETGLLSKLINPEAFADIKENYTPRILLKEKTGNLTFNALYMPLPSLHKAGGIDGFIGIPFFDSEKELDMKLIQLLTTIMNIFVGMFIVFMLITNWASRALTVPLKLVTQKLKQTTLTGKNEELVYESADEIGLLVSEYNQMLRKLDENKKELAMREKEAAWREMARQVAHEIKNPLTPMKLSLQYLQKAIAEKRDNLDVLINKISGTLITQIEILSDIATSFSNFTALPDLKLERINLTIILKQSLDLHSNPGALTIRSQFEEGNFEVIADENILMRTFNNLMINALQAIPAGRHPEICVSLKQRDDKALISFHDNGTGIPADIQHKIFVPNFSTKFTGSGIGLAVAKKGIETAGGRIWFETQEGEGTTFYIELPLAQE
ncbi:sensor histidine kinase [Adhaeribacter rhizoryzae]|uniref:histidine kinase n=1 Tax=Adhaeribacter rhizoryzae TaxID=2607907 RepID=A0A5M6DQ36_9BACT|nr:HAMP domain-containing sensor histidine kinase [Adhaeribacter rhizoryzae]KAA5549593.1 HAMP domain-containing histidine kinase [Adhaeribacter rhizoryzae]